MTLLRDTDAVLVDLYDTLVHVAPLPKDEALTTLLGVSPETLTRAFAATGPTRWAGGYGSAEGALGATVKACGIDCSTEKIRELCARNVAAWVGGTRWFDDSIATLAELRARGIKTALISNCDHRTRPAEALGLADKVDVVLLSVDVRLAKPQPEIFRLALDRLGVAPARAVFVDDTLDYCAGARVAGVRALLIDRKRRYTATPAGADAVIPDLRALL
jgi:putative hydrolase of the HAD superfamily